MKLEKLPLEIQSKVKSTLNAYSSCKVYKKSNGEYQVMVGISLHNGTYSELIGEYLAHEVFTLEERIVNYVKQFKDFPWHCDNGLHYSGDKDWKAINSDWKEVELVNGNLVFT